MATRIIELAAPIQQSMEHAAKHATRPTRRAFAPSVHPTARAFWLLVGGLITWLALMSVVPGLIANRMGYVGTLPLFALSNTPGYSPTQAHAFLTTYGASGRMAYAASLGIFDIVFPILYGCVLSVGLRLIARGLHLSPRLERFVGRTPLVAVAANWVADVCILALLFGYPSQLAPVATAAGILTFAKLAVLGVSFLSLVFGAAVLLIRGGAHRISGHATSVQSHIYRL